MALSELPPHLQDRVTCSIAAAVAYGVPVNIMLALAEKENGRAGQWRRNANGSADVGPMQFNTNYLRELARYGIAAPDVAAAGCYSYNLAAWRVRLHIKNDAGDLWTRVANYHSRTAGYNAIYRADLMRRASRWANWIEARFATRSLSSDGFPLAGAAREQPAQAPRDIGYLPRKIIIDGPVVKHGPD